MYISNKERQETHMRKLKDNDMRNLNAKEREYIGNYLMDLEQNDEVRCALTEEFVIMEKYGITGIFGLRKEIEQSACRHNVDFDFCTVCLNIEELLDALWEYSVNEEDYWIKAKICEVG